jgi:hypothetical protein
MFKLWLDDGKKDGNEVGMLMKNENIKGPYHGGLKTCFQHKISIFKEKSVQQPLCTTAPVVWESSKQLSVQDSST